MVVNILKDGTTVNDLTGHVVRVEEAEALYRLMDEINKGINQNAETYKRS